MAKRTSTTSSVSRCAAASLAVALVGSGCIYKLDRTWTDGAAAEPDGLGFADQGPPSDAGPRAREGAVADHAGPAADQKPPPDKGPPADTSVDSAPAEPCAEGAPLQTYDPTMVVCSLTPPESQCVAARACNEAGGWTLCSASQFLARGGQSTGSSTEAWIGGCIRSGGAPHAPKDGICGPCYGQAITDQDFIWPCPPMSGSGGGNADYVGLAVSIQCLRLGTNEAGSQGYWGPGLLNNPGPAAVCCR